MMISNGERRTLARLLAIVCVLSGSFWGSYVAMGNEDTVIGNQANAEASLQTIHRDTIEDSLFDPLARDPSCGTDAGVDDSDCYSPPATTVETETIIDASCFKGGEDYSQLEGRLGMDADSSSTEDQCVAEERVVDRHWGSDPALLAMRDQLRDRGIHQPLNDRRPPIFLLPGLASTRLVAWKLKKCPGVFGTDIKVQDNVWLNINLVIQMGTVNVECMTECLRLGVNQSDTHDQTVGCKLRPDEGLDAIASLAPGGIGSSLLVGGTNTVYSWLIQWLADNLSYDVTNIIGLPYDWRLSPDKMEARDGFLTMMRRRMEAAVASNGGQPGIMVAHSMGNLVFRYFLDWLRVKMREEAYEDYLARARRREQRRRQANAERLLQQQQPVSEGKNPQQPVTAQEGEHLKLGFQNPEQSWPIRAESEKDNETPIEDEQASLVPGWMIMAAIPGIGNVLGWFASSADEDVHAVETVETSSHKSTRTIQDDTASEDAHASNIHQGPVINADDVSNTFSNGNEAKSEEKESQPMDPAMEAEEEKDAQLRELAIEEGDAKYQEWVDKHIWTYIGLSAPLLGAVNPLRAVLSGENMGLPISDEVARYMEVTFGSTHTINPVSVSTGFCDNWDSDDWNDDDVDVVPLTSKKNNKRHFGEENDRKLACLDDIMNDIEFSSPYKDPWKNFPSLRSLLRDRMDWNTVKPMVSVIVEHCQSEIDQNAGDSGGKKKKKICVERETLNFGPKDVENGRIFDAFHSLWPEEGSPLIVKREQLEESFFNTKVTNMLNRTWERPNIKHVVMAYGVDVPTEVGYVYKKTINPEDSIKQKNETSGLPNLKAVLWEESSGRIMMEPIESMRGSLANHFIKKKSKKVPFGELNSSKGNLKHSGDGSVPYLSLSWVHTWLLHAARARRFGEDNGNVRRTQRRNALDHIAISHRPRGATVWVDGPTPEDFEILDPSKLVQDSDTGTDHPHGTRYKPLMTRYHNTGISRSTGIEYTTTIIEAVGVEHKETTRNYDILAAVFTDAVKFMHDDFGLVGNDSEKIVDLDRL